MTQKELSNLYYLNREIERLQDELDKLNRAKGRVQVTDSVKGSSKEYPYTSKNFKIVGVPMDALKYDKEVEQLKSLIDAKLQEVLRERIRLEEYIQGIEDSETRLIFSLRYINNLNWKQVARHINPYATEDSVKKKCQRHLKKEKLSQMSHEHVV